MTFFKSCQTQKCVWNAENRLIQIKVKPPLVLGKAGATTRPVAAADAKYKTQLKVTAVCGILTHNWTDENEISTLTHK